MSERLTAEELKEIEEFYENARKEHLKKKQECIEKAEAIYQEMPRTSPTSLRYETKVSKDNIDKSTSKMMEQINEARRKEIARQESRKEISDILLQLLGIFAPFLIIGLLALIAVYIL